MYLVFLVGIKNTCMKFRLSKCTIAVRFWSCVPVSENPSCLHTTVASVALNESSHTVPQTLALQISRRPSRLEDPFTSRTSPASQPARRTLDMIQVFGRKLLIALLYLKKQLHIISSYLACRPHQHLHYAHSFRFLQDWPSKQTVSLQCQHNGHHLAKYVELQRHL